jgi:8-oxo-dGTP pyrophosphatase MutT (NUDIX family)
MRMTDAKGSPWLAWAREIQALSQSGLTYSTNEYERLRYQRLAEVAAEILQGYTGLSKEEALESFSMQPGYATPKVDVRGAVVRDDEVLLVQERVDGRWCMPGGWADVGDLPSEVAAREVWEESGFQVVPYRVVGVFDANRGGRPLAFYHAYKIIFLCRLVGGQAQPSHETAAVEFFAFDKLPPLSSNRTNERHLAEVRAHLRDPYRPVAFD